MNASETRVTVSNDGGRRVRSWDFVGFKFRLRVDSSLYLLAGHVRDQERFCALNFETVEITDEVEKGFPLLHRPHPLSVIQRL